MMKEARTGGRFVWHQDYGYWYHFGFLVPDLMTVFIALDPCRPDNGCLQVLEGSHRCGRIEHNKSADQLGADLQRVGELKTRFPLRHVEMEPGDALFFHCNLLHTSNQNLSPNRRWAFLVAYNKADNTCTKENSEIYCTKLEKVPDTAILENNADWDLETTDFYSLAKYETYLKTVEDQSEK